MLVIAADCNFRKCTHTYSLHNAIMHSYMHRRHQCILIASVHAVLSFAKGEHDLIDQHS